MPISKRLHLIYIRQYLWAGVACQLRTVLAGEGQRVIFVGPAAVLRGVAFLELVPPEDMIIDRQVETVVAGYDDIHVYVQYSDTGVKEYGHFFDRLNGGGRQLTLSFYADGYTNKIHAVEEVTELFATRPLKPGTLFLMDHTSGLELPVPGVEQVYILNSGATRTWLDGAKVTQLASDAIGALSLKAKDVILILMRPWGSTKYTKGRLEFDNSEIGGESAGETQFAAILRGLVASLRADIGHEVDIVVHPDNRDGEFCRRVLDMLKDDFTFQLAAPDWPEFMSFDAFIYHFERLTGARLHVVGFDSTASLPFLSVGIAQSHYFGAPESVFPPETADSIALRTIKTKLRSLREFIDGLPQPRYDQVTVDRLFFKMKRRD